MGNKTAPAGGRPDAVGTLRLTRDETVPCSHHCAARTKEIRRAPWHTAAADRAHHLRKVCEPMNEMAKGIREATGGSSPYAYCQWRWR